MYILWLSICYGHTEKGMTVSNQEGLLLDRSGGEGGGRGDRDGEQMWLHGWFMSMYDKTHYNTVK